MVDIHQAKQSFVTMHGRERVHVRVGDTVASGHWLLDSNPAAFEPLKVTFAAPVAKTAPPRPVR